MKYLVPIVLALLSIGFYLALNEAPDVGRLPSDDQVEHSDEWNKVTGEHLKIEIIRCGLCGTVLKYQKKNLKGITIYEDNYTHHCGSRPIVRYNGSGIWEGDFIQWLDHWQKRLRFKR